MNKKSEFGIQIASCSVSVFVCVYLWLLPILALLLFVTVAGAEAQTSPAAHEPQLDCRIGTWASTQQRGSPGAASQTVFPVGGKLGARGYSNCRWIARPTAVKHAVVMIHGVLRNPDNYYLPARIVLERKSLFTAVALISVGFDDRASAPGTCRGLRCSIRSGNMAASVG